MSVAGDGVVQLTGMGDNNYLYPAYPTRSRVNSLIRRRGKREIMWLRLGLDLPKSEFNNGSPGDLSVFSMDVVDYFGERSFL